MAMLNVINTPGLLVLDEPCQINKRWTYGTSKEYVKYRLSLFKNLVDSCQNAAQRLKRRAVSTKEKQTKESNNTISCFFIPVFFIMTPKIYIVTALNSRTGKWWASGSPWREGGWLKHYCTLYGPPLSAQSIRVSFFPFMALRLFGLCKEPPAFNVPFSPCLRWS